MNWYKKSQVSTPIFSIENWLRDKKNRTQLFAVLSDRKVYDALLNLIELRVAVPVGSPAIRGDVLKFYQDPRNSQYINYFLAFSSFVDDPNVNLFLQPFSDLLKSSGITFTTPDSAITRSVYNDLAKITQAYTSAFKVEEETTQDLGKKKQMVGRMFYSLLRRFNEKIVPIVQKYERSMGRSGLSEAIQQGALANPHVLGRYIAMPPATPSQIRNAEEWANKIARHSEESQVENNFQYLINQIMTRSGSVSDKEMKHYREQQPVENIVDPEVLRGTKDFSEASIPETQQPIPLNVNEKLWASMPVLMYVSLFFATLSNKIYLG